MDGKRKLMKYVADISFANLNSGVPPAADHDCGVTGITFVANSEVVNVAVGDMTDLPVQEDEYDTNVEDDTPPDITFSRSGGAIYDQFCLDQ